MTADAHARCPELAIHSRAPVPTVSSERCADVHQQPSVFAGALRRRPLPPGVKAAPRHAQDATHHSHGEDLLRVSDERKLHSFSDSFAKKAAAFFRIAFSIRSCAFSRRNRFTSSSRVSRAWTATAAEPTFLAAALRTQRYSRDSSIPSDFASSDTCRPSSTMRRTASARNPSEYRFFFLTIGRLPRLPSCRF